MLKPEEKQFFVVLETILICILFASLWAMAGSGDFWGGQLWLRRFLAPSIFCLWAFLRSNFDWRYFVQMPLMMGAISLPYGADILWEKILLRSMCGLTYGISGSVVNLWHKNFLLAGLQILLTTLISITAGVYNPFANPMIEQFIIGLFVIVIPAFSVIKKSN